VAEVFVSYSRADAEFVRRLDASLTRRDRAAWVDWKDIPLTAEWLEEIRSGIEAADNFVFVISPDSVKSTICQKEIEHAAANNKRLIPILYRPVANDLIPEPLSRLNFVFMRDSDDFESSFNALIDCLDSDLESKRTHTRLLVRASEWQLKQRDKSLLLRGSDLQAAEEWQERALISEPKPTEIHFQFILFSRRAENHRQKQILTAAVLALVVTAALAVAALLQRNTARREANIAEGRRLAAESSSVLGQKPDLALILSVEAENLDDSFETRKALFTSLQQQPNLHKFLRAGGVLLPEVRPARQAGLAFRGC
jgi:hypothetical protein